MGCPSDGERFVGGCRAAQLAMRKSQGRAVGHTWVWRATARVGRNASQDLVSADMMGAIGCGMCVRSCAMNHRCRTWQPPKLLSAGVHLLMMCQIQASVGNERRFFKCFALYS